MAKIDYLKAILKDPMVAALAPSSKFVIRRIIKEIKPEYKYIIEYGAGDGVITKEILKILPGDGRLIVVEINSDFIPKLKSIKDNRLTVIHGDVWKISQDLSQLNLPRIDMILSGIPFSFFKPQKREQILVNTYSAINRPGKFVIYQTSLLVKDYLEKISRNKIRWSFEPRNFMPYFIMIAEK